VTPIFYLLPILPFFFIIILTPSEEVATRLFSSSHSEALTIHSENFRL
jgi:hypothetical protein